MIAERVHALAGLCLLAAVGCAMQVGDDAVGVEETEQALNAAPDFRVGVLNISYDADDNLTKGNEAWTARLSTIIGGGTVSPWSSVADPTGIRIGMQTYAGQPANLSNLDFRLLLSARGPGDTSWLTVRTGWASDGGGLTTGGALAGTAYPRGGAQPSEFKVGLETRPWPSTNSKILVGYRFGITACAVARPINFDCGTSLWEFTDWNVDIPGNVGKSWSHTSNLPQGFAIRGAQAKLDVAFR